MIDAWASVRNYADHMAPVWAALPAELRGRFCAPAEVVAWLNRPGAPVPIPDAVECFPDRRSKDPVLVAGFTDHHAVRPRPTVLMNHGAGQSYFGDPTAKGNECYAGGPGRERVLVHLEPGDLAARATAAAGQPFAVVGCPKLDPWHALRRDVPDLGLGGESQTTAGAAGSRPSGCEAIGGSNAYSPQGRPVVAVGFHHDARGCPEQRTALPHYADALRGLASEVSVLGHGHPRSWERTHNMWTKWGVTTEPDFFRVLDGADVYVTDNSSTAVEFASVGKPVVLCSAPWYRRDVHHGGRFWTWTDHMAHVSEPGDLAEVVAGVLAAPQAAVSAQWPVVASSYVACDGRATERAVAAIRSVLP